MGSGSLSHRQGWAGCYGKFRPADSLNGKRLPEAKAT